VPAKEGRNGKENTKIGRRSKGGEKVEGEDTVILCPSFGWGQ